MRTTTKITLIAALALAGCAKDGGIFTSSLPDETRVVDGPSLALPPQYDLRPPREAQDYDAQLRAQNELSAAQSMITGVSPTAIGADGTVSGTAAGGDDQWLVDKAAQQSGVVADPNVRQELAVQDAAEQKKKAEDSHKGALDRWFGGGK